MRPKITSEEISALRDELKYIWRHKWTEKPTFAVLQRLHRIFDSTVVHGMPSPHAELNPMTSARVLLVLHLLRDVEQAMFHVGHLAEQLDMAVANCQLDIDETDAKNCPAPTAGATVDP